MSPPAHKGRGAVSRSDGRFETRPVELDAEEVLRRIPMACLTEGGQDGPLQDAPGLTELLAELLTEDGRQPEAADVARLSFELLNRVRAGAADHTSS